LQIAIGRNIRLFTIQSMKFVKQFKDFTVLYACTVALRSWTGQCITFSQKSNDV